MKTLKISILISFIILFFSCSKSSDDETNSIDYNFTINQNLQDIQELDNITFSINNVNNASINQITWFVNNIETTNSFNLDKTFSAFGSFTIKAKIDFNNSQSKTIEKIINVTERPKYIVKIKKVEILSYSNDNIFRTSLNGYYVKMKFDIRELDDLNSEIIKYISTENSDNWGNGSIMYYPKIWDISNANYTVKVYKTGNYYPNNQQDYNTNINFFAAISQQLVQQPYFKFNDLKLDLNPYRSLQPTTMTLTNINTEIRLTLQWN